MTDVTYVQYVGCAAIECRINGELTELCRTDMKNALAVQTASKQLRALTEGRTLTPRESEETCCPKCGTPYKSGTKTCPICSSKQAVLLRLLPFAKPYKLQLGHRGAALCRRVRHRRIYPLSEQNTHRRLYQRREPENKRLHRHNRRPCLQLAVCDGMSVAPRRIADPDGQQNLR